MSANCIENKSPTMAVYLSRINHFVSTGEGCHGFCCLFVLEPCSCGGWYLLLFVMSYHHIVVSSASDVNSECGRIPCLVVGTCVNMPVTLW